MVGASGAASLQVGAKHSVILEDLFSPTIEFQTKKFKMTATLTHSQSYTGHSRPRPENLLFTSSLCPVWRHSSKKNIRIQMCKAYLDISQKTCSGQMCFYQALSKWVNTLGTNLSAFCCFANLCHLQKLCCVYRMVTIPVMSISIPFGDCSDDQ